MPNEETMKLIWVGLGALLVIAFGTWFTLRLISRDKEERQKEESEAEANYPQAFAEANKLTGDVRPVAKPEPKEFDFKEGQCMVCGHPATHTFPSISRSAFDSWWIVGWLRSLYSMPYHFTMSEGTGAKCLCETHHEAVLEKGEAFIAQLRADQAKHNDATMDNVARENRGGLLRTVRDAEKRFHSSFGKDGVL